MNIEHYHIYAVEGAEQLAEVAKFKADDEANTAAIFAWCESFGSSDFMRSDTSVVGITGIKGEKIPAGWKIGKQSFCVPDRRTTLGKKITKEMKAFKVPSAKGLARTIGVTGLVVKWIDGMRLLEPAAFDIGDRIVVISPKDGIKPAPDFPGCRLIKASEYYAMKEQAGATV